MRRVALIVTPLILANTPLAEPAHAPPANPLIDYAGFEEMVREVGPIRDAHRLPWA